MDIFEIEYDTIDEKRLVNVPIQLVNVPPPRCDKLCFRKWTYTILKL